MAELDQYTWIYACAFIFAFAAAFGIGANDVANSFGTSVGSKALTIGQAVMIAAVCEFAGAALLGANVIDTIKGKIAKTSAFTNTPELFMWGMFCVLIAAAFWDNFACHLGLPVSTTHTTVGATVGMALVIAGSTAVVWSDQKKQSDGSFAFPGYQGISATLSSWVVSPLIAGVFVLILYGLLRTFVLRSAHSFSRAMLILPILTGLTLYIVVIFILQTGNNNAQWKKLDSAQIIWIPFCVAIPIALAMYIFLMPYLRKIIIAADDKRQSDRKSAEAVEEGTVTLDADGNKVFSEKSTGARVMADVDDAAGVGGPWTRFWDRVVANKFVARVIGLPVIRTMLTGVNYDVHKKVATDKDVQLVWEHAEVFDAKTEHLFKYLQIFSAMVMSFAHGSNDVANAMGPFSAVHTVWQTGKVPSKSPVETWILVLGGLGIALGLLTYGYKIMRVLGVDTVKLTCARGFCAELSTATTVIVASRYGIPVSTTQIITGAVIAIGLFEGAKGINWKVLIKILFGWVLTLLVACCVSAAVTSFGVFAPNKVNSNQLAMVNKNLNSSTYAMLSQLNRTANSLITSNGPNVAAGRTLQSQVNAVAATTKRYSGFVGSTQNIQYVWGTNNQSFVLYNSTKVTAPGFL